MESPFDQRALTTRTLRCALVGSLDVFADATLDAASQEHVAEPPSKRRRISDERPLDVDDGDLLDGYALLSHVKIVLTSEASVDHVRSKPCPRRTPVHLCDAYVNRFSEPLDTTLRHLTLKDGPSSTISFVSESESELRKLLRIAKRFGPRLLNPTVYSERLIRSNTYLHGPIENGQEQIFELHIKVRWKLGSHELHPSTSMGRATADAFRLFFPEQRRADWTPQDFYDSVHVPKTTIDVPPGVQTKALECELFPFQKRAVKWLLSREKVQIDQQGRTYPLVSEPEALHSFEKVTTQSKEPFYVSRLWKEIHLTHGDIPPVGIHGGILAEEMGLGKTVELISLICLHKRKLKYEDSSPSDHVNSGVIPSAATLIITPPAILEQWENELNMHAPTLKVYHYRGLKNTAKNGGDEEIRQLLLQQDVVLTTYPVLAKEIHYAKEKPDRNLRHEKKFAARTSPLVQLSWWRVCLDEAQMVESGVSNAAIVARTIPRINAWAVTGTPLRKDVQDLLGLLTFLRYEPYCRKEVWKRVLADHHDVFTDIFSTIALRHSKARIRDELRLPPQRRVVISVPFTAIEEQHYNHLFQQMCDDCGLDSTGGPLRGDWDPEDSSTVEKMRSWLTRLRQTCLHPEVGGRNRKALGHRDGPLRTVEEVLEVMIDQNETLLRSEERSMLMAKIMRGHLVLFGKRTQQALAVYLDALDQSSACVAECREQLAIEKRKLDEEAEIKGAVVPELSEDEDDPEKQKNRMGPLRARLRNALELQHICAFFTGTAFYQLKDNTDLTEPDSERFKELEKEELEYYEQAKVLRQELLKEVSKKATGLISKVKSIKTTNLTALPNIEQPEKIGGIENRRFMQNMANLNRLLNAQADQIEEWRQKLMDLLLVRLVDQEEDPELITGEEYEDSTKQQEQQYVYHDVLRAAIADRNMLLTGQSNELVNHEMKEALRLATHGTAAHPENKGHAPELTQEVIRKRNSFILPEDSQMSIRALITEVRAAITAVRWQDGDRSNRAGLEATFLERELESMRNVSQSQSKALAGLEKELEVFRSTMNARVEFHKQLQEISDTVQPLQEEMSDSVDEAKVKAELTKEGKHSEKLASLKTKRRFLHHLRNESSATDEQKTCVICQGPFEIGVITVCAHQFCKDCIRLWWSEHRNCPQCRRHLKLTDFHDVTYKPRDIQAQEEQPANSPEEQSPATPSSKSSIYSDINNSTLNEIKSIELDGSFGTKIDTIARHLLWIREHDPGAKTIIFSQYRDFLQVLGHAFSTFKLGFASIADKTGIIRFKEDPSVEAFLLHAKADSSGLNLVNATHVFLCEPLINVALELQAIARVHRIGQRRPTTVTMFLVQDTVEEAIYDTSVTRRQAHVQRTVDNPASHELARGKSRATTPNAAEETALDVVNSMALQTAPLQNLLTKGQSGGELVSKEDLWSCLFKKPRRKDGGVSRELEEVVGRHLRAEAAEDRRGESSVMVL